MRLKAISAISGKAQLAWKRCEGQVVEAEAERRLADPILNVGLLALPGLKLAGASLLVVGDERPVVPLPFLQVELLSLPDGVAADH
jgi:hypothetical protein